MGFTFAEFDGGRRAVFHGGGFAEMGWGALHRATADESELGEDVDGREVEQWEAEQSELRVRLGNRDRKSTRLNSSHGYISYAVFCLKKKKEATQKTRC